ncbi:MAG: tetratricopeptide repeat protein [Bdellovibrionota bacterium]
MVRNFVFAAKIFWFLSSLLVVSMMAEPALAVCPAKHKYTVSELLTNRRYQDAEELVRQNAESAPEDLQAQLALADVYWRWAGGGTGNGVLDPKVAVKGEELLAKVTGKWPAERCAHLWLLEFQQGAANQAALLKSLSKTAKQFQAEGYGIVRDLLPIGEAYIRQGRPALAEEYYKALSSHFPNSGPVYAGLGAAVRAQGKDFKKALDYYAKAYKFDPEDPAGARGIAETALFLRDFATAKKFYLVLADLEPEESTSIYFTLAMIAMRDGGEASLPAWDKYNKKNQRAPEDQAWVRRALLIQERIQKGMKAGDFLAIARDMVAAGTPERAIPVLVFLQGKLPREALFYSLLGEVYLSRQANELAREQYAKADLAFQKKASAEAKLSDIQNGLARSLLGLGRNEEARENFEKLAATDPAYPGLQHGLGSVYERLKKKDLARKYLEECVQKDAVRKDECAGRLKGL